MLNSLEMLSLLAGALIRSGLGATDHLQNPPPQTHKDTLRTVIVASQPMLLRLVFVSGRCHLFLSFNQTRVVHCGTFR